MVDLNPRDYETSRAASCDGGLQVGFVKRKENTKAGFSSPETHACIWAGTADAFLDLHTFVPQPWNASVASAIELDGDLVRIVGSVEEFIFHGDAPSDRCAAAMPLGSQMEGVKTSATNFPWLANRRSRASAQVRPTRQSKSNRSGAAP